ncbi:TorF family putative porin [Hansschlegelia plantiphila]|nr:TorF family putative porin [Hansschlegelia plantiphila]
MKRIAGLALSTLVGVAAGGMMVGAASAADLAAPEPIVEASVTPVWDIAFGVKLTSDYVFRGITNSKGNPAVQGYAELQAFDWIYAGIWSSSVDFSSKYGYSDPSSEVDLYGGFRHTWDYFSLDIGGLYYWYPGEKGPARETDYWEIFAKPSFTFGGLSIGPTVYWTSDFVNTSANATYLSGVAKYTFALDSQPDLSFYVSGEFGKQWVERTKYNLGIDYLSWNAGGGVTYKAVTLDLRYSGADLKKRECTPQGFGLKSWCGDRFMASLSFDTSLNKLK